MKEILYINILFVLYIICPRRYFKQNNRNNRKNSKITTTYVKVAVANALLELLELRTNELELRTNENSSSYGNILNISSQETENSDEDEVNQDKTLILIYEVSN